MLLELKVKNFAIIEDLSVEFYPGFNVLSGETGSGKSVLLKSLGLLMGQTASPSWIREGSGSASVEGYFSIDTRADIQNYLNDLDIPFEASEGLIVRRVLTKKSNNRVYINGSLCPLSVLKKLVLPIIELTGAAVPLIEITGQHDSKNLLNKSYHRQCLDYLSNATVELKTYQRKYAHYEKTLKTLDQLLLDQKDRDQKLDYFSFQLDELLKFNLDIEEDSQLDERVKSLKQKSKVMDILQDIELCFEHPSHSPVAALGPLNERLQKLDDTDTALKNLKFQLNQIVLELNEVSFECQNVIRNLSSQDSEGPQLEERLAQLRQLQKKHGRELSEILKAQEILQADFDRLKQIDFEIEEKRLQLEPLKAEIIKLAQELHEKRLKASPKIQDKINQELIDLEMKGLELIIGVTQKKEPDFFGSSDVEFFLKNENSSQPQALIKTASGGELSRILLSLKNLVGQSEMPRTYLFDEVDTGVSGRIAKKVAKKLKSMAKDQQVICVTHLPQVASAGDFHFKISKIHSKTKTEVSMKLLSTEERITEVAGLFSDDTPTRESLIHAEKLLLN